MLGPELTAAEAAIYESLVVPRYMSAFAAPCVEMLIQAGPAKIAQLGCRTGYPSELLIGHFPSVELAGVDSSEAALQLANAKAKLAAPNILRYLRDEQYPCSLQSRGFTHAIALHPMGQHGDYRACFQELKRLLMVGGQAVVSLPLRGSFPEVYDMLREYALRFDQSEFGEAVDAAAASRPNPENLMEQAELAGLSEVNVAVDLRAVSFENGRDFLEDPIARLVVGPDIVSSLGARAEFDAALDYATRAISMYWSELSFELTVNIGTMSARCL